MSTKHEEMQRFIRHYKQVKSVTEIDMKEVAKFAEDMGWPLPKPQNPLELLAKEFSAAAREEVRHDKETKRPYKANLAITTRQGDQQMTFWIDTDEAPRHRMVKALHLYREQMVGEAVIGTNTADHWNRKNPKEEPLLFDTDLSYDTQWRLNGEEALKEVG
jgi:hypothetical protein